jgi:undecaprenyl-phosphate 4-deoxy-4-formamido-L-arabinose transferase
VTAAEEQELAAGGLTVIVPLYKSAEILPQLLERLEGALRAMGRPYEIILVNDASPDETWSRVQGELVRRPRVVALNMSRNYGQHNALLAGIRIARSPLVVTMDDDLQHPPEEIPRLIAALTPDLDVVYGYPLHEERGLSRKWASRITKLVLSRSMNVKVAEQVSAFRLFRTRLREAFATYRGTFVNIDVLLTWGTNRFAAIRVQHNRRAAGPSTYTLGPLITLAMNLITGFSVLPLQAISLVGIGMGFFGFLILLYILGLYFVYGAPPPGFTLMASMIAIFSGVQILALGIMGEYLWRMYYRVMDRPSYLVRDRIESSDAGGTDNA